MEFVQGRVYAMNEDEAAMQIRDMWHEENGTLVLLETYTDVSDLRCYEYMLELHREEAGACEHA